jgi:hypothetical protein
MPKRDFKLTVVVGHEYKLHARDNLSAAALSEQATIGEVLNIVVKGERRSLSQNGLFHDWCGQAATRFGQSDEKMKILLKHKFLGYEDIKIGNTEIKPQLRHTSELDPGEMNHFMTQVEEWCSSNNCLLTIPADSQYMKLREAQSA